MKKWIVAASAVLLVWNVVLTIRIFSLPDGKVETQTGTGEVVPVDYSSNVASVVDEVRSSIVRISGVTSGTGVIYAEDEDTVYVVTASEIVHGAASVDVTFDSGASAEATLVGYDEETGIAVLSAVPGFSTVAITAGDSDAVNAGEYVVVTEALNADNMLRNVGLSVVSAPFFGYAGSETTYPCSFLETSLQLSKHCAGSPMLNAGGQLIGMVINTVRDQEERHTYAVSANEVVHVADEIIAQGNVERGYLDITGTSVTSMRSYEKNERGIALDVTEGVLVNTVSGNCRDILMRDDVIIRVDEQDITSLKDLRNVQYASTKEQELSIEVIRDGNVETLQVKAS